MKDADEELHFQEPSERVVPRPSSPLAQWTASIAIILSATPAFAARAKQEGNKLVYKDAGQTIVIQAWGRDSLRVRIAPDGGGQTSDWALDIPLEKEGKIEISPEGSHAPKREDLRSHP